MEGSTFLISRVLLDKILLIKVHIDSQVARFTSVHGNQISRSAPEKAAKSGLMAHYTKANGSMEKQTVSDA